MSSTKKRLGQQVQSCLRGRGVSPDSRASGDTSKSVHAEVMHGDWADHEKLNRRERLDSVRHKVVPRNVSASLGSILSWHWLNPAQAPKQDRSVVSVAAKPHDPEVHKQHEEEKLWSCQLQPARPDGGKSGRSGHTHCPLACRWLTLMPGAKLLLASPACGERTAASLKREPATWQNCVEPACRRKEARSSMESL